MKRSYTITIVVVVVVIAAAVGGYFWYKSAYPSTTSSGTSAGQSTSSSTTQQTTNAIAISNFAFNPSSTTIPVGTTVTWTNNDSTAHTVVFDSFASPEIAKNGTFQHTFSTAGTFQYHCGIHPTMTGTVIVQ